MEPPPGSYDGDWRPRDITPQPVAGQHGARTELAAFAWRHAKYHDIRYAELIKSVMIEEEP